MDENAENVPQEEAQEKSKGLPIKLIIIAIVVVGVIVGGLVAMARMKPSGEDKKVKKDLVYILLAEDKFFVQADLTTGRRKQLFYTFNVGVEKKDVEKTTGELDKCRSKIKEAIRGIILEQDYAEMVTNEPQAIKEIKGKVLNYLENNISDAKIHELVVDSWHLP